MRTHRKTLRLLQVVHRHGDRAPTFNPEAGGRTSSSEEKRWSAVLAKPQSRFALDYPIINVNTDGPYDDGHAPWGCLTSFGGFQCQQRGKILRRRYHAFLFGGDASPVVSVLTSNFVRTQLSAQYVLSGLLPRSPKPLPDPVRVVVETPEACIIAVIDPRKPLFRLVRRVMSGPEYAARDDAHAHVRAELESVLPYFQESADASPGHDEGQAPRFMWIRAGDYYMAYENHGLTPRAAALARVTLDFLEWRFRRAFAEPEVRHLATGGLLAALAANVRAAAGMVPSNHTAPHVALFSGHDTTLMPLVIALLPLSQSVLVTRAVPEIPADSMRATALPAVERTLHEGNDAVAALASHAVPWPAYASAVAVELHHVPPSTSSAGLFPSVATGNDRDAASHAFMASASSRSKDEGSTTSQSNKDHWRVVWSFDNDVLTVDALAAMKPQTITTRAPVETDWDAQLEADLISVTRAVDPQLSPEEIPGDSPPASSTSYPRPSGPAPGRVLRMTGWMPISTFLALADTSGAALAALQ